MSNILRLVICCVAYVFLFGWSVCILAEPVIASEYISNYDTIRAVQKMPLRAGTWKKTPTVIVCEYAPISETQVKSAVGFWKSLGHRFFRTQYKYDPLEKCKSSKPVGYIIIHLETLGIPMHPAAAAETHFFVNNDTNAVEWAIIYVRNDTRATVLEHEIGHALGYLHYDKPGHLMNSMLAKGGWKTDGLEKSQR